MPLIGYLLISYFTKKAEHMPGYYIPERVDTIIRDNGRTTYDTVYHRISDFNLTNQLGQPVTVNDLDGKIVLADFFFTACPSVCPELTANLKKVQDAFAANDSALLILSFTVDPLHDSVPRLKQYADKYKVDQDKWWFLTGDKAQLYRLAKQDFFVNVEDEGAGDPNGFIHTQKWVLLDKHQYIRGYYDGLDSTDIQRCMNDIALLMLEKEKR